MEVVATSVFVRCAKAIAKKHRSFNDDYQRLVRQLEAQPTMGVDLGGGLRKVRMAIRSKGKGKSGGCRVITFGTLERNGCLYLVYAYDKSERESVGVAMLKRLVGEMGL